MDKGGCEELGVDETVVPLAPTVAYEWLMALVRCLMVARGYLGSSHLYLNPRSFSLSGTRTKFFLRHSGVNSTAACNPSPMHTSYLF